MYSQKQNQYFSSVEEVLNRIRPAMQADGGNVELVSAEENGIISVRLQGTCLSCPSSSLTLKQGIERTLKEHLDWVTEVVRVP
jgi:Fe-S cluster biogenesis protein NfuA